MGVGGVVVDHGLVGIGHGDILVGEGPAGRLDTGLGGGAGGIAVEIVRVGEVVILYGAVFYVGVATDKLHDWAVC